MKAQLKENVIGKQFTLLLTPDHPNDVKFLKSLAESRADTIIFRGFKYLDADFEFLIQESAGVD